MKKAKIGTLPENPAAAAVYRRKNGSLYIRLNERFHVKGKAGAQKGEWIGDGSAEELDPEEEVEVVFRNDC